MSQPFSFPPPPPPPPRPSSNQATYHQQNAGGGNRGRGGFSVPQQNTRGGFGRSGYLPHGSHRGGGYGSRGNNVNRTNFGHSSLNRNETSQRANQRSTPYYTQSDGGFNPAQKRVHSAAFNSQQTSNSNVIRARPLAPPPVPSFGIDFNTLLPKKPEPSVSVTPIPLTSSATARKKNLLGLTPALQATGVDSDSESDPEEESKLANALSTNPNSLSFEYNGQAASLSTPEEIALWIAERRKKWPTEAKREIARKQAEERKKKYAAEKAARLEASRSIAKARQEEREKQKIEKEKSLVRQRLLREQIFKASAQVKQREQNPDVYAQNANLVKADKLRKKAEKIAQKLKLAESALDEEMQKHASKSSAETQGSDQGQSGSSEADGSNIDALLAQVDQIAAAQQNPSITNDLDTLRMGTDDNYGSDEDLDSDLGNPPADDTSTSGSSSDSDSDAAPEQLSSKHTPASHPTKPPRQDNRPLCTNFTKTGRCKFGRRCHYRHEKIPRERANGQAAKETGRRKGLYQVMVEKELESERRRALKVIIGLGEGGWLDEVGSRDNDDGSVRP